MTTSFKTVRLVVSELGARADRWVDAWSAQGAPVLHLAQQPHENTSDFVIRVREAVEALTEANRLPSKAVLIGAGDTGVETLASRQFALRVILSTLVRHGGGDVFLTGENRDRFAMSSLATTAKTMVEGTGVTVQVISPDAAVAAA